MNERILVKFESEVPNMKRVGFIGGMGQWATLDLLNRIFRASVNYPVPQYGNRGYPPLDIRMINKAPMVLNSDGSFPKSLEPSRELLEAASYVGKNSDFIILSANTAHLFSEEIEKAADKPILSIVDVTIDEVKRRGLKKVGVTAIGITLEKELFQKPLREIGVEAILLSDENIKKLENKGIYEVQEGEFPEKVSQAGNDAVDELFKNGAEAVILGCTEMPILLGERANIDPKIINPSQLLAEAVIRKSLT